eukprot:SAG31_NODE_5675_length_2390_cov_7.109559_2_plen_286_part_00
MLDRLNRVSERAAAAADRAEHSASSLSPSSAREVQSTAVEPLPEPLGTQTSDSASQRPLPVERATQPQPSHVVDVSSTVPEVSGEHVWVDDSSSPYHGWTGTWVAATPTGRFVIVDFGAQFGGHRPVLQTSLQPGRAPHSVLDKSPLQSDLVSHKLPSQSGPTSPRDSRRAVGGAQLVGGGLSAGSIVVITDERSPFFGYQVRFWTHSPVHLRKSAHSADVVQGNVLSITPSRQYVVVQLTRRNRGQLGRSSSRSRSRRAIDEDERFVGQPRPMKVDSVTVIAER